MNQDTDKTITFGVREGDSESGIGYPLAAVLLFLLICSVILVGNRIIRSLDVLVRDSEQVTRQFSNVAQVTRQHFELSSDVRIDQILALPRYADPLRLQRFQSKVYSQHGEDGEIAEIFRRIGTTNKTFAEFGSADGTENNTIHLLNNGWKGLWLDGDRSLVDAAKTHFFQVIRSGQLKAVAGFITAENIEQYFHDAELPEEFDLMSVDIDRNDWHVWKAITHFRPRVVVIEYNSIFPPSVDWVVPYDPKAGWDGTSYFGASLKAFERLGQEKGYSLVGCDISGTNAYFVRSELTAGKFAKPFSAENHYEPPRYYLTYRTGGHPRQPY